MLQRPRLRAWRGKRGGGSPYRRTRSAAGEGLRSREEVEAAAWRPAAPRSGQPAPLQELEGVHGSAARERAGAGTLLADATASSVTGLEPTATALIFSSSAMAGHLVGWSCSPVAYSTPSMAPMRTSALPIHLLALTPSEHMQIRRLRASSVGDETPTDWLVGERVPALASLIRRSGLGGEERRAGVVLIWIEQSRQAWRLHLLLALLCRLLLLLLDSMLCVVRTAIWLNQGKRKRLDFAKLARMIQS
ncbi:unnamed protein product [Urochloa humidicola]